MSAFDFEEVRKDAQARQNGGLCQFIWNADPASRASLEKCPPDAPLCIAWAYNTAGRLNGMLFKTSPGEPLVGRVRHREYEEAEYKAFENWLYYESPVRNRGTEGQTGHCAPDYELVFKLGIDGIRNKLLQCEKDAVEQAKKDTYRSFVIVLDAFSDMVERAASFAATEEAAERCRRVAHKPPETFREALQLLWFVEVGIMYADQAGLVNPGRLDKLLIPYYLHDIERGTATYGSTVQDIALLYLYVNDFTPRGLAYGVMVGGNSVNPLSYAAVEATRFSRMAYPSVGICANEKTPHDLARLAVDIISEGWPNPCFFNDNVIRKGLESYNIPSSESGNYINSTCVEITPCGASNVWVASPYYNLCQILLNSLETPCDDYDSFMDLYMKNLDAEVARGVAEIQRQRIGRIENRRRPLQSIFTKDCIGRGLDIEEGGALYNWAECSFVGLANLVDSLIVLREEVFNQKNLSQSQMLEMLKDDFKGNETLRQKFLNKYPKYGNDNPEADAMIQPIIDHIKNLCATFKLPPYDSPYIPGTFCWEMHQRLGAETVATPDGRHAGFPFADGAGPAQGREKHGPTSAVKSVCAWNHSVLIGGSAFNMKYPKSLLASDESREKLLDVIRQFVKGGGFQTQINVTDNEILKAAIKDPENYADLIVRIGGYTDYFVRLSPGMQQEVLMRTQYSSC